MVSSRDCVAALLAISPIASGASTLPPKCYGWYQRDEIGHPDSFSAVLAGFDLHFRTLAKATLTGLYGR
jgi:hypothetical protein